MKTVMCKRCLFIRSKSERKCPVCERNESALYGLVVETKMEGPILHECTDMSVSAVSDRMQFWRRNPDCIRVCMVRLEYVSGNETLMKYDADFGDL